MKENLENRLVNAPEVRAMPNLYRLEGRVAPDSIGDLVDVSGWLFIRVDAGKVAGKADFLAAARAALRLPDWAGHNWDAFEELVNDLSWLPPAAGYLVLFDGLSRFSRAHPDEMGTAIDILAAAAANRLRARDVPLVVLFRGAGRAARRLPAIDAGPSSHPVTGE